MMMKRLGVVCFVVLVTGCQPGSEGAVDEQVEVPTNKPAALVEPEPEPEPEYPELELVVNGPEEMVFDWTTDRCEDENIPDIAPRAFRDADGMVSLLVGADVTYRMVGPDLNNLQSDCSGPIFTSDTDPDPAMFNEGEWLGSVYTEDGQTIYAIVHNEYRGHLRSDVVPGLCPSGDYLACLDTSLTLAISTDGGASFHDAGEPPDHLIATLPYQYEDESIPTGLRQPSNIIKGPDGYYYVFSNIADYPRQGTPREYQRACVMRTDNLADPKSWRYWDGGGFNGVFLNPYVDEVDADKLVCLGVDLQDLAPGLVEGITYNTVLEKYIIVGISDDVALREPYFGVYYSVSDDLIDWSPRRLLLVVPVNASVADNTNDLYYAYPTLMDPDSTSLTFDTSDDTMYLYIARLNAGGNSLDRDIVRYPVAVAPTTFESPVWEFDTDGDAEDWLVEFDIEGLNVAGGILTMQSAGEDPILKSPAVELLASENGRLSITMKVSSGGDPTVGQIFFVTNDHTSINEEKSITFDVIADDEFHTYDLDMGSLDTWQGLIRQIRFDPVTIAGTTIEIDQIEVGN